MSFNCENIRHMPVAVLILVLVSVGCAYNPLADGLPEQINCRSCHGDAVSDAPPASLDGKWESSDVAVGAHRAHLSEGRLRKAVECTECHIVPVSVEQEGHVDPSPAEVVFGKLALADGADPTWDRGALTCSGTYCHGATLLGGDDKNPVWTRVDGSQVTCGSCHGYPPPPPHDSSTECQICHPFTVDATGEIDISGERHINGMVEAFEAHPDGYADPALHGADMLAQRFDCRTCHGADLGGREPAPSCDSCHRTGWRADCVYCHGGLDNQTGAPPVDLRGRSSTNFTSVGAHTRHVASTIHPPYACSECHAPVVDVITAGHAFDSTPGLSEVVFSSGLSAGGLYASPGCLNLYCHGTGLAAGNVQDFSGSINTCDACHPSRNSSEENLKTMSGMHKDHREENISCASCHPVVDANDRIVLPHRHVDGSVDVALPNGTYDESSHRCSSTRCHEAENWLED